jgi:hypothetical protein
VRGGVILVSPSKATPITIVHRNEVRAERPERRLRLARAIAKGRRSTNGLSGDDLEIRGLEGLDGGVSSHMRTGLDRKFPVIREFKREFESIWPTFGGSERGITSEVRYLPRNSLRNVIGNFRRTNREFEALRRVLVRGHLLPRGQSKLARCDPQ